MADKYLNGLYAYRGEWGTVTIEMRETKASFTLRLVKHTGRWIDPPLDDVFRNTDKCVVRKAGSKHALTFWDDGFCIYPYRVGVPFPFDKVEKEAV